MTLDALYDILNATFPGKVCYRAWETGTAPDLPWVCYFENGAENEAADDVVYESFGNITVELYTDKKDETNESTLESALTSAGIFYEKECTYIDSEKLYEAIYTMEV